MSLISRPNMVRFASNGVVMRRVCKAIATVSYMFATVSMQIAMIFFGTAAAITLGTPV